MREREGEEECVEMKGVDSKFFEHCFQNRCFSKITSSTPKCCQRNGTERAKTGGAERIKTNRARGRGVSQ
jgi:hypothetical protein